MATDLAPTTTVLVRGAISDHTCPTCESPEYKEAERIIGRSGLHTRNWGHLLHDIATALIARRSVVRYPNYDICPNCGGATVEPDGKEFVRLHCPKCKWEIGITVTETQVVQPVETEAEHELEADRQALADHYLPMLGKREE